jgi:hypothetical protein
MVICPSCGYESAGGGKFCEKCGTGLQGKAKTNAAHQEASSTTVENAKTNEYVEKTKQASLSFFHYFIDVIKQPFSSGKRYDVSNLTNSIITMVLFALFLGLTAYFGVKDLLESISSMSLMGDMFAAEDTGVELSFFTYAVKPFFFFAIFVFIVAVLVFVASKLSKIDTDFKSVLVRFGSYLVPFLALVAVGFLLSLIHINLYTWFTAVGFIGTFFIVPVVVLLSMYRENRNGLDIVYSSLLVTVGTSIVLFITQKMIIAEVVSQITSTVFDSMF